MRAPSPLPSSITHRHHLHSVPLAPASGCCLLRHKSPGSRRPLCMAAANLAVDPAQRASAAARNVHWHCGGVSCEEKERRLQQQGCVIWLTGLSGAGKSTVGCALEQELFRRGGFPVLLDGDNVRHGLNNNLGFTEADRAENIRRVGEVAKLMVESGLICICSLISPFEKDRQAVRERFPADKFICGYLKVPAEVCEERDPKGLWKAARAGKIKHFTGIDAPYEAPEVPEITLEVNDANGSPNTPQRMAQIIVDYLQACGKIPERGGESVSSNAVSAAGARRSQLLVTAGGGIKV